MLQNVNGNINPISMFKFHFKEFDSIATRILHVKCMSDVITILMNLLDHLFENELILLILQCDIN